MNQIPAWLLNLAATYAPPASENNFGQVVPGTAVNLTSVYLEATLTQEVGNLGEQVRDDMTLYFDCENSRPVGQTFVNGGTVVYGGVTYLTRNVRPLADPMTGAMHHWEVGLVGR